MLKKKVMCIIIARELKQFITYALTKKRRNFVTLLITKLVFSLTSLIRSNAFYN